MNRYRFLYRAVLAFVLIPGVILAQTPADADFDRSGAVGFSDFIMFAGAYGSVQARYDLDGDGAVGFSDFLRFAGFYGRSATAASGTGPGGLPAFPGAEGFGAYTPGGRRGKVYPVTTLGDSGPGSLREACEAVGPRIVVFRVAGPIDLRSTLSIANPYITIAGQTAPGSGICIRNYSLYISTHDVIVRYLRVRPGDLAKKEMDAITVVNSANVVIDHCSTSWGIDETLSVTWSRDVTVQWCMITESLNDSYHHKGPHGYGSIINGQGITFHHNIYAHHVARNPHPSRLDGQPESIIDLRNNLIYNWGSLSGHGGILPLRINYVGNYLRPGPSTRTKSRKVAFRIVHPQTTMFVADNDMDGLPEAARDNWLMIQPPSGLSPSQERALRAVRPFPVPPVHTDLPEAAYRRILDDAGATRPSRDGVDARIVREIQAYGGRIIDSQTDVGGWPEYRGEPPGDMDLDGMPNAWEMSHGLSPLDPSDNSRDGDGDGYTNIEEYINRTDPNVVEGN